MRITLTIDPSLQPIAHKIIFVIDLTNGPLMFDAHTYAQDCIRVLGYKPEHITYEIELD